MSVEDAIKEYDSKVTNMPIDGFRRNDKGNIVSNSLTNVELILDRDPLLHGKIAFNEFTYEIELLSDIPQLFLEKRHD